MKYINAEHTKESYICELGKLKSNTEYKFEVFASYPEHNGQAVNGIIKTGNKGKCYKNNSQTTFQILIINTEKVCCLSIRVFYVGWSKQNKKSRTQKEKVFYLLVLSLIYFSFFQNLIVLLHLDLSWFLNHRSMPFGNNHPQKTLTIYCIIYPTNQQTKKNSKEQLYPIHVMYLIIWNKILCIRSKSLQWRGTKTMLNIVTQLKCR